MLHCVGSYLDKSSSLKHLVAGQLWNVCGLHWASVQMNVLLYYTLIFLLFCFKIIISLVEDFPGGVAKPAVVCWLDFGAGASNAIFVILLSFMLEAFALWNSGAGAVSLASKVCRAYLIAAYTVPLTPIRTSRDRLNASAPAILAALKAIIALMAMPAQRLPLTHPGQPFETFTKRGKGLTNDERRKLVEAILSSMCQFYLFKNLVCQSTQGPFRK